MLVLNEVLGGLRYGFGGLAVVVCKVFGSPWFKFRLWFFRRGLEFFLGGWFGFLPAELGFKASVGSELCVLGAWETLNPEP